MRNGGKSMAQPDRSQITIWRMRFASWITKTTDRNSEYVIIIAFLQQQWLHEHASVLRHSTLSVLYFVFSRHKVSERSSSYITLHDRMFLPPIQPNVKTRTWGGGSGRGHFHDQIM